ncbi:MAG: nucleotidyltransferase family protein, partial [Ignavibacteria bacterium]
KVILFGSRVKGKSKINSDFDLAVELKKPDSRTERIINDKLEDISGLYTIDIIYLDSVEKEFKDIVLKTGKVVYEQ